MKLDWKRIARTALQAAAGAGATLITAFAADFTKEGLIAASVQFACTVGVAILMNIKSQIGGEDNGTV